MRSLDPNEGDLSGGREISTGQPNPGSIDQAAQAVEIQPLIGEDSEGMVSEASGEAPEPRNFTIVNRRGLHARASARFVETVEQYEAEVTISRDGMSVGGQSIMGLMMLAASQGTSIAVSAIGPDAEAVLDALEELVAGRFGEDC